MERGTAQMYLIENWFCTHTEGDSNGPGRGRSV
jgi:hypothetical protein